MSRRTPRWKAAEVIAVLERAGFEFVRQRGAIGSTETHRGSVSLCLFMDPSIPSL